MRLAVLLALVLVPTVAAADPDHEARSSEVGVGAAAVVTSEQGTTTVDPGFVFRVAFGRFVRSDLVTSLELADTIFVHPIGAAHEIVNSLNFGIGVRLQLQGDVFVGAGVGLTHGTTNSDSVASMSGWAASGRIGYVLSRAEASERTLSLALTHTWLDPGPGSINAVSVLIGYQFL